MLINLRFAWIRISRAAKIQHGDDLHHGRRYTTRSLTVWFRSLEFRGPPPFHQKKDERIGYPAGTKPRNQRSNSALLAHKPFQEDIHLPHSIADRCFVEPHIHSHQRLILMDLLGSNWSLSTNLTWLIVIIILICLTRSIMTIHHYFTCYTRIVTHSLSDVTLVCWAVLHRRKLFFSQEGEQTRNGWRMQAHSQRWSSWLRFLFAP